MDINNHLSYLDAETLHVVAELQRADIEALTAAIGHIQVGADDAVDLQYLVYEIASTTAQVSTDKALAHIIATEQLCGVERPIEEDVNSSTVWESDPSDNVYVDVQSQVASDHSGKNTIIPSIKDAESSCSFCLDGYKPEDVWKLPCGDQYCKGCIQTLLEQCLKDESLFPPRCCKTEIILAEFQSWLPTQLIEAVESKRLEHDATDKTYCHQSTCSAFFPPQAVTSQAVICPECNSKTCTLCKMAAHDGECPLDEASKQVEDLAKASGWQRCPGCRKIIELTVGCNHMICFCGEQFCYVCTTKWKNCPCVQWDEKRLYLRAAEVAQRARGPEAALPNGEQVQTAADELRRNHHCTHEDWGKISGAHTCDHCNYRAPSFIFRCRNCAMEACWRCRRNRL